MGDAVITGANRGLGLALTQTFLADGWNVWSLCRSPENAGELNKLKSEYGKSLEVQRCDLSQEEDIVDATTRIMEKTPKVDILLNNAAILHRDESLEAFDSNAFLDAMRVNAVAPTLLAQKLLPALKRSPSPKIINISSASGVTSEVRAFNGLYSYKASKAALNMLTKVLAFEIMDKGVTVLAVDPGWMKTKMGGTDATDEPKQVAKGIARIARNASMDDTGKFIKWDGGKTVIGNR